MEIPKPWELTNLGGEWLSAARKWIQWHCHNGSNVTWGSNEELQPPITAGQIEDLAAHVASAAIAWWEREKELEAKREKLRQELHRYGASSDTDSSAD